MIEHIVMWKLHDHADGHSADENFERVRNALIKLSSSIPVIRSIDVKRNVNPDRKNQDMVLISTFDTLDDLSFYAGHPDHIKVGALIGEVAFGRTAIDYYI